MCMKKIIQLAKSTMCGKDKEDIYPKTNSEAVITNLPQEDNTLKDTFDDLYSSNPTKKINAAGVKVVVPGQTKTLDVVIEDLRYKTNRAATYFFYNDLVWNDNVATFYITKTIKSFIDSWRIGITYFEMSMNDTPETGETTAVDFDIVDWVSEGANYVDIKFEGTFNSIRYTISPVEDTANGSTWRIAREKIGAAYTLTVAIDANGNITNGQTISDILETVAGKSPVSLYAVLTVGGNEINYYFNIESYKLISGTSTVSFSCIYSLNNSLIRMTATASTGDTKFTMTSGTILTL